MEGRVPFSLIAVIALLLAGLSAVYVAMSGREAAQAQVQLQQLRVLESVAGAVHHGVGLEAHALALEAIRRAGERPGDPDRANREFERLVAERLAPSFPRTVRGFTVALDGLRVAMFLQPMRTIDVVPSGRTTPAGADRVETLDTSRPAVVGETSRVAYFSLAGSANYTVRRGEAVLRIGFPFRGVIDSPYPFLRSAARGLRDAADGSESELARLVRYIVTTAAQFRALQGFAVEKYGEPGTWTGNIITPSDVEVAVNLALMLEELRRFRGVDERSPVALDGAHFADLAGRFAGSGLVPDVAERTMGRLLATYARGGTTDAADLFALYNAFDADPVRLNRVLAQILSAVMDQQVLRFFEYLGQEKLLDWGIQVVEWLVRDIDAFLGWVTDGSHEAEIVKDFTRELFAMAGEPAALLGPFPVDLPSRDYVATNGDGTAFTISVSAHTAPVEFDAVDLLVDHDDLWRAHYETGFAEQLRAFHRSARDFLTDLSTRIADDLSLMGAIPNPTLRGAIDPKDDESVTEFVRRGLDDALDQAIARLRDDPTYLDSLIGNVWRAEADVVRGIVDFVIANHDVLASGADQIALARDRLAAHQESQAPVDPDYWLLDGAGLQSLRDAIRVDVDASPWVAYAYMKATDRDRARLEAVYDRATDAATPPEGGGIYQRLRDAVVGEVGVLSRAGELLRAWGDALLSAEDLHNVKLLVETPTGPFEFWYGDREAALAAGALRTEGVTVRQAPATLRMTRLGDSASWDTAALQVGDLWIDVRDPTTVPRGSDSPNVHWTEIGQASRRPFETRWDVRVAGLVRVDAMSARAVRVGPDGHEPEVASEAIRIDFSLGITLFTGWPLAGVAYADTNTVLSDVWAKLSPILEVYWRAIVEPQLKVLLDAIHALVEIVIDIIRRVLTPEVVRVLGEVLRVPLEQLQDLALYVFSAMAPAIDGLISAVGDRGLAFDTEGLKVRVSPSVNPRGISFRAWRGDLAVWSTLVIRNLTPPKPGEPLTFASAPVDVTFGAEAVLFDGVTLRVEGDALMVTEGRLVTARGIPKDGGWALEFSIPAIDSYKVETPWEFSLPPIPTPLGTLSLTAGVELRYKTNSRVSWLDVFGSAFMSALSDVGGFPKSLDDLGRLLQRFLERLVEKLLTLLALRIVALRELTFYLEGVLGAGPSAGAGFRLAFVIDGGFLAAILRWLIHSIVEFLRTFPDPSGSAHYETFPVDLWDYLALRVELFGTIGLPKSIARAVPGDFPTQLRMAVRVQANVPAIANIFHRDVGRWRVDFGVYLEQVPAPIVQAFFGKNAGAMDVWFVRGSIYETAP